MTDHLSRDLALALIVTALGAVLAWFLSGGLPLIGIDDAAITRSYSENLARGAGYVYNVGGERVEGSTTLVWVLTIAGLYLITPTPEMLIVALCALLALGAVFCAIRMTRLLTEELAGNPGRDGHIATAVLAVILLASPGYFLWTVWTMMEVAIWSALVLWLTYTLVRWVESDMAAPGGGYLGLFLPALLLPMTRPEGIAVCIGLILLGMILSPPLRLRGAVAAVLALAVFVAITLWRMNYFGQPFPNTFYAKVSSDRLQDLADGLKYAFSFILGAPFAELLLAAWAVVALWALAAAFQPGKPGRGLLIPAGTVFGLLAVYAALGGDHFALWRFYQPMAPLLPVAAAIGIALGLGALRRRRDSGWPRLPMIAGALFVLIAGWMQYYQARFDVRKEFVLVEQGLGFGQYLNGVAPRPSIGVGPAGGIALAYDGHIYDLLGLNWTEMAHANPIKVGMRNHASFDKPTFWEHRPEVLANFNRPCSDGDTQSYWSTNDAAFDGLFSDPRFREEYLPVKFHDAGTCWPGFAVPAWLDQVAGDDSVQVLSWANLTVLD